MLRLSSPIRVKNGTPQRGTPQRGTPQRKVVLSPTCNSKLGRDNDSNKFTTTYSSSFPLVKSSGVDENAPNSHSTPNQRKRRRNDDNFPVGKDASLDDSRPVPSNQFDHHEEEFSTLSTNLDFWLSEGAAAKREKKEIYDKIANRKVTKKSQKEKLKQAEEKLEEANLAAVLELSLMHNFLFSSGKDEFAISEYIPCYFEFQNRLFEQTAAIYETSFTNNEMSTNIDNNDKEVIAFLSKCFFDDSAIATAERNLDPSLSNPYNQIIRDRLMLLDRGAQKKIDADTFLKEWEDIDIREKLCVERIKCKKDFIVEKEVKDKKTKQVLSTYNILVIGEGDTWKWHNMGGIKRDARGGVVMNYHPPSEEGVVDEDNGCVTANTRYLPTIVQRLSEGELDDEGKLTEETKQSLDQHLKIFDFWTFFPMTKDYYLKEAELLAESGDFDINDLRLSGLLQVAGQIMLSSLRGQVFRFAVGHADVMRTAFSFSGAGISPCCCAVGPIPHGETMNVPKLYMTSTTFSDNYLKRASIAANILFGCVPLMSVSRNRDVFMVISQRKPLTAAEETLLLEMRRKSRIKPVEIRVLNDDEEKEVTVSICETRGDAADKLRMSVRYLRKNTDKNTGIVTISGVPVCQLVNVGREIYNGLAESERGVLNGAELERIHETIQDLLVRRKSRIKPVEIRSLNEDEEKEETVCICETRDAAADKLGMSIDRLRKNTDKNSGILTIHGVQVCRLVEVDRKVYHGLAASERGVVDGAGSKLEGIRETIRTATDSVLEAFNNELEAKVEARNSNKWDHSKINEDFKKNGAWGDFLD